MITFPRTTDPIAWIIWGIDIGIITLTAADAFDQLRKSIAANAQKEGREVTSEEEAVIKAAEAESDRRVRGV